MLHYTRKTQSEEDPYFRSMSRSRRLHRTKIHNIFFSLKLVSIMVLTGKTLDEILAYLDNSMNNLAKDTFENLELEGRISRSGRIPTKSI